MREIIDGLHVGDQADFEDIERKGHLPCWYVVHACKEPHHRNLLGYKGKGAPKEDPEYLVARRGKRLYLNMVDLPKAEHFEDILFVAAMLHIEAGLAKKAPVLIHCNKGESRAPTLALIYLLASEGSGIFMRLFRDDFDNGIDYFKVAYPEYKPGKGMLAKLKLLVASDPQYLRPSRLSVTPAPAAACGDLHKSP